MVPILPSCVSLTWFLIYPPMCMTSLLRLTYNDLSRETSSGYAFFIDVRMIFMPITLMRIFFNGGNIFRIVYGMIVIGVYIIGSYAIDSRLL